MGLCGPCDLDWSWMMQQTWHTPQLPPWGIKYPTTHFLLKDVACVWLFYLRLWKILSAQIYLLFDRKNMETVLQAVLRTNFGRWGAKHAIGDLKKCNAKNAKNENNVLLWVLFDAKNVIHSRQKFKSDAQKHADENICIFFKLDVLVFQKKIIFLCTWFWIWCFFFKKTFVTKIEIFLILKN